MHTVSTANSYYEMVVRFLAAFDAHNVQAAVACFTDDAQVVELDRDDGGRLVSARTGATGRQAIATWLTEYTRAGVRIRPTTYWQDKDVLVVVAAWSISGPHDEHVSSSSIGRYIFRDTLIERLVVSSPGPS